MYKPITKDEIIVMILMFSFAVLYRILDDFAEIHSGCCCEVNWNFNQVTNQNSLRV